jgi:hypothetical protein
MGGAARVSRTLRATNLLALAGQSHAVRAVL